MNFRDPVAAFARFIDEGLHVSALAAADPSGALARAPETRRRPTGPIA
ncbi:hypothetical protein NE236_37480 [Actinoallomurus purpureus]|nr:hypothetical protein [Actinoallomurus purpureus]MCO6010665.1 hypothetical protein [Actinoallomurus purpureus]